MEFTFQNQIGKQTMSKQAHPVIQIQALTSSSKMSEGDGICLQEGCQGPVFEEGTFEWRPE